MNRYALVALVTAMLSGLPAGASAATPPRGLLCGADRADLPGAGSPRIGLLSGGPLVTDDRNATVSMRCSVQVGRDNDRHVGPDLLSVASSPSTGVTAIEPTPWSMDPRHEYVHVCTEATVDGVTYYWDDVRGEWSASTAERCSVIPTPVESVWNLYDVSCTHGLCIPPHWLDACPVLSLLAPGVPGVVDIDPEGDVAGLWDCPPYGV